MKKFLTLLTALIVMGSMSIVQADYYVAGTMNSWNASSSDWKMSYVSGTLYSKTATSMAAGDYQFKITQGSWSNNWGAGVKDNTQSNVTLGGTDNVTFTLSSNADVTFYFDAGGTKKIYVTAVALSTPVSNPVVILRGSFNSWGESDVFTDNGETATFVKNLSSGSHEFKITVGGAWKSKTETIARANSGTEYDFSSEQNNTQLTADVLGDYTFTYTYATKKLSVTFPDNSGSTPDPDPTPRAFDGSTPLYFNAGAVNWWTDASAIQKATFTKSDNSTEVVTGVVEAGNIYAFTPPSGSYVSVTFSRHNPSGGAQWNATGVISLSGTEANNYISSFSDNSSTVTWDVYVYSEPDAFVAGSVADIFGTTWDASAAANKMTWDDGVSKYTKTYTVTQAYKSVALKVVYGETWYGLDGGEENVKFSLSGAGTFTVLFDKTSHAVTVEGSIVGAEQFDFGYVTVAGNGNGNWLNGEDWNASASENRMVEVSTDIYEITFTEVAANESQFQFTFDGAWDYQFGGTFSAFGEATSAVYGSSGGNITFTPVANADVTIRLDLSNFDFATKLGATFTVSQVAPEPDCYVAGSVADIFGTSWTSDIAANKMTWDDGVSKYTKTYTVTQAYKSVALKVVYGETWYGLDGGEENVKFSLSGAGTFTVLFDKTSHAVTVEGSIVGAEQFDFGYVTVAGNGNGNWLNGEDWNASASENRMVEVSTDIYEITFTEVAANESQFQFTFDGAWDYQFGGTFSAFGEATSAVYGSSGGNITFTPVANADVTIRLDLSNFDFATKLGATFTVSQVVPEPVYIDIRTGLTAGNYYTVCWPKAMTAIKGGTLWSFNGKDDNFAYIVQEEAPFEAGKPYIIYATSTKLEAIVEGADADAGSNNGLYGTLDYMDAAALEAAGATYMLYQNALRPIDYTYNNHLAANRAYIKLAEISAPAPAPGRNIRKMPMEPQVATGIDALNVSDKPVKMVIDGQLFIIRGEKMYDATGHLVK